MQKVFSMLRDTYVDAYILAEKRMKELHDRTLEAEQNFRLLEIEWRKSICVRDDLQKKMLYVILTDKEPPTHE